MAWSNPFSRRDENTRTSWGYTFQWTPQHKTAEELHPLKFTYDKLADECLDRLNIISPPVNGTLPRASQKQDNKNEKAAPQRDLYAILRDNAADDEKLGELWNEVNDVPDWVDWDQIERGQEVFYRYGVPALNALGFQSLLGGMAGGRVVETLARTGGFSTKVARHRLFETTQYVLQCTKSLESIKPGGDGMASSVRVRLLHAAVRKRIMKLAETRPEYYSVEEFGVPINDLDCIGTIGTFSTLLIWLGLPRQGVWMRDHEITDYIALWRLVAYYLGTPTEPYENRDKARVMLESLLLSEIQPTDMSQVLASNIITSLENTAPTYASRGYSEANVRWLNGKDLADALAIRRPSLYNWALVLGYCVFAGGTCYICRTFPNLDKAVIVRRRSRFWRFIMNEKHGLGKESSFEFKYVPDYSQTTELGQGSNRAGSKFGVEIVGLMGLAILALVIAAASYVIFRLPIPRGVGKAIWGS